jgi:hypothetical protein
LRAIPTQYKKLDNNDIVLVDGCSGNENKRFGRVKVKTGLFCKVPKILIENWYGEFEEIPYSELDDEVYKVIKGAVLNPSWKKK